MEPIWHSCSSATDLSGWGLGLLLVALAVSAVVGKRAVARWRGRHRARSPVWGPLGRPLDKVQLQLEKELEDSDGDDDGDDEEAGGTSAIRAQAAAAQHEDEEELRGLAEGDPLRDALLHARWIDPAALRRVLWPRCEIVRLNRDERAFEQGQVQGDLWLLLQGRVSLVFEAHSDSCVLAVRQPGQPLVSLLSLLACVPAVGSAVVESEQALLARIPLSAWRELLAHEALGPGCLEAVRGEALRLQRLTLLVLLRFIGLGRFLFRPEAEHAHPAHPEQAAGQSPGASSSAGLAPCKEAAEVAEAEAEAEAAEAMLAALGLAGEEAEDEAEAEAAAGASGASQASPAAAPRPSGRRAAQRLVRAHVRLLRLAADAPLPLALPEGGAGAAGAAGAGGVFVVLSGCLAVHEGGGHGGHGPGPAGPCPPQPQGLAAGSGPGRSAWPPPLCLLGPGCGFGLLEALAQLGGGQPLVAAGGAGGCARVAQLPQSALELVLAAFPPLLLPALAQLQPGGGGAQLPLLAWQADAMLDWRLAPARRTIVRAGEPLSRALLVLNGRLALYDTAATTAEAAQQQQQQQQPAAAHPLRLSKRELGKGESLGELCLLGAVALPGVVRALRDSVVALVPAQLLQLLGLTRPRALLAVARALTVRHESQRLGPGSGSPSGNPLAATATARSFASVVVLPASPGAEAQREASAFCAQLRAALQLRGPTLLLSLRSLPPQLQRQLLAQPLASASASASAAASGGGVLGREGRLQLWVAEQERTHALLLFQADARPSAWTHFCLRQADVVLLLCRPGDGPQLSAAERLLWPSPRSSLRTDVVLLHAAAPPGASAPSVLATVLRQPQPHCASAAAPASGAPSAAAASASSGLRGAEAAQDAATVEAAAAAFGSWAAVRRLLRSRGRRLELLLARVERTRRLLLQGGGRLSLRGCSAAALLPLRLLGHSLQPQPQPGPLAPLAPPPATARAASAPEAEAEAEAERSWLRHVSAAKIQKLFALSSLRRSRRLAARVQTPMAAWLAERQPGCCHHVRMGQRSDFERLGRLLTGGAVGLVLGGGGARGFAHIGVLRALSEAGLPVDMVGGTSQGAFVGALWALSQDVAEVRRRSGLWAAEMRLGRKLLLDLTLPVTAWLTGAWFNRELAAVLGGRSLTDSDSRAQRGGGGGADVQIEDLWIPFFCVSANLSRNRVEVHTRGCLWRYVRASMSLAAFLPPVCERETGDLLVDGGYVNVLPADVMRSLGANTVVTVDVAQEDDNAWAPYGDSLDGWAHLWQLLWPFGARARLPSASDVQSRLAFISSYARRDEARARHSDLHVAPAVSTIGLLDFHRLAHAEQLGYEAAQRALAEWLPRSAAPEQPSAAAPSEPEPQPPQPPRQPSKWRRRSSSLTDAAAAVVAAAAAAHSSGLAGEELEHMAGWPVGGLAGSESVQSLLGDQDEAQERQRFVLPRSSTLDKLLTARTAPRALRDGPAWLGDSA